MNNGFQRTFSLFQKNIFIVFVFLYALTTGGHFYSTDGEQVYKVGRNILIHRDPYVKIDNSGKKVYTHYGVMTSVLEMPLIAAGALASKVFPYENKHLLYESNTETLFVSFFNSIVTALTVALIFTFIFRLGYGLAAAFASAIIYGIATQAWPYSMFLFSDPLQTLLLLSSIYYLHCKEDCPVSTVFSGILAGMLFLVKLSNVIPIAIVGLYVLATTRKDRIRRTIYYGIPVLVCVCIFLLFNYFRFHDFLQVGGLVGRLGAPDELMDKYKYNRFYGIYGILFSQRGIFVSSPPLVFALFGMIAFFNRYKSLSILFCSIFIAAIFFVSSWNFWDGGATWGCRYFLITNIFFIIVAAPFLKKVFESGSSVKKLFVLLIVVTGIAIQGVAVSSDFFHHERMTMPGCVESMLKGESPESRKHCSPGPIYSQTAHTFNRLKPSLSLIVSKVSSLTGSNTTVRPPCSLNDGALDFWCIQTIWYTGETAFVVVSLTVMFMLIMLVFTTILMIRKYRLLLKSQIESTDLTV